LKGGKEKEREQSNIHPVTGSRPREENEEKENNGSSEKMKEE